MTAIGPWFFSPIDDCTVAIVEEDGSAVFDMMAGLHSTGQAALESNARIVAAAPALLEALQWALGQIEDDMDPDHQAAMAGAHAAINRAIWGQK